MATLEVFGVGKVDILKLQEYLAVQFPYRARAAAPAAAAKPAAATSTPAPAAEKKKEEPADDDIDFFGDEDEDDIKEREMERKAQAALAAQAAKGKVKPVAKTNMLLDIKPWDDETDMVALEAGVRAIEMDGLLWGSSKLVPVGYGIKKLQIICIVEDDKVTVDDLDEKITALEDYVQSLDVAAMNKV